MQQLSKLHVSPKGRLYIDQNIIVNLSPIKIMKVHTVIQKVTEDGNFTGLHFKFDDKKANQG